MPTIPARYLMKESKRNRNIRQRRKLIQSMISKPIAFVEINHYFILFVYFIHSIFAFSSFFLPSYQQYYPSPSSFYLLYFLSRNNFSSSSTACQSGDRNEEFEISNITIQAYNLGKVVNSLKILYHDRPARSDVANKKRKNFP